MGLVIEKHLRSTELTDTEREICLRGIAQVAMADGVEDPRERAYLETFVDEFFPETDPTDSRWNAPITDEDLEHLERPEARQAFLAYGYITAYIDEDFDPREQALLEAWASKLLPPEEASEISTAVREFLYRRSVFAYASRLGRLDEAFAVMAAKRFDVPLERARQINAGVFNALMTLKRPVEPEAPEGEPPPATA